MRGSLSTVRGVLLLGAGVLCLAFGAALGWLGALSRVGGPTAPPLVSATAAAQSAKAAVQAAHAAEGWARVASGEYTLAASANAQAQAARRQAEAAKRDAERSAAIVRQATAQLSAPVQPRAPRVAIVPLRPRRHAVRPALAPVDEGCRRATIYERSAAAATAGEAKYNAVRAGFAMNAHCAEPRHGVIDAYLFAQRAAAERALGAGDWRADLARSDELLVRCVARAPVRATREGCRARLHKNARVRRGDGG